MSSAEPLQVQLADSVNEEQGTSKKVKTRSETEKPASLKKRRTLGKVTQGLFNFGFIFALVLAGICLFFSATYLHSFLTSTNAGIDTTIQNIKEGASPGTLEVIINGRLVMARIALLSCGIFVGIAFGFLGFALFLMGIKESVDVDVDSDTYKAKFARMSPGVLIIICSSILTGVCATRQTPFWYENTVSNPAINQQEDKSSADSKTETETNKEESDRRNLPSRSTNFSKP